jgi:HAD superfamily hydrolase (TIGR01509 family)
MTNEFQNLLVMTDLDGTVIDSKEAIANSAVYTLNKFGVDNIEKKDIYPTIGVPIKEVFGKFLDNQELENAASIFREDLVENGKFQTHQIANAKKVLLNLKKNGAHICLVTNKRTPLAQTVINQQNLEECFDLILGSDIGQPKPSPELLNKAMESYPSRLNVMIGDRPEDIEAGQQAGVPTVFFEGDFRYLLLDSTLPNFYMNDWEDLNSILEELIDADR